MNKYSYFEEKQAMRLELDDMLQKNGDAVLEYYLSNGFEALVTGLNLFDDGLRRAVFDYLMLERRALLECLRRNKAFFMQIISEGRGHSIRPMLGLRSRKYNALWREALDLLALYFVEKKVIEKMTNFELEKFFSESIFGKQKQPNSQENDDGKTRKA